MFKIPILTHQHFRPPFDGGGGGISFDVLQKHLLLQFPLIYKYIANFKPFSKLGLSEYKLLKISKAVSMSPSRKQSNALDVISDSSILDAELDVDSSVVKDVSGGVAIGSSAKLILGNTQYTQMKKL